MKALLTTLMLTICISSFSQSALYKMSKVFTGNYSEKQIKSRLDIAMKMYRVEINENNYLKCASALVGLRESCNGKCSEMEILSHMIKSNTGIRGVTFANQAALSATLIEAYNK